MNPEDHYAAKRQRTFWRENKINMKPDDFYEARRKRIFWETMIFCLVMVFVLVVGSIYAYLTVKWS